MNVVLHFIYRYETSQYKKASDKLKGKILYELFFTFRSDMKPCDTKRQVTTQKNKMI
jgi:hypothetical protein